MYQSYFRFVGGGHTGFFAFVNAIVHTVMYLYYLLAACGPGVKKYLGWKRYFLTHYFKIKIFMQVSDKTSDASVCLCHDSCLTTNVF